MPFRECRQHLFWVLYGQQFGFSPLCIIFSYINYKSYKKKKKRNTVTIRLQEAQIISLFFPSTHYNYETWCIEEKKKPQRQHTCTTQYPHTFTYKGNLQIKNFGQYLWDPIIPWGIHCWRMILLKESLGDMSSTNYLINLQSMLMVWLFQAWDQIVGEVRLLPILHV